MARTAAILHKHIPIKELTALVNAYVCELTPSLRPFAAGMSGHHEYCELIGDRSVSRLRAMLDGVINAGYIDIMLGIVERDLAREKPTVSWDYCIRTAIYYECFDVLVAATERNASSPVDWDSYGVICDKRGKDERVQQFVNEKIRQAEARARMRSTNQYGGCRFRRYSQSFT